MRTLKKFFYTLTSIITISLLVSAFFTSCQKNEIIKKDSQFDYEKIGIQHNEGLNFVYNYLNKQELNGNLKSAKNILLISEEGTYKFFQENDLLKDKNVDIAIKEASVPFTIYKSDLKSNLKSGSLDHLWPDNVDSLLTNIQKQYLNKLDDIININQDNLDAMLTDINKLEVNIKENVPKDEQPILLSSCAIARHSFQYWHDNIDKWNKLLSNSSLKSIKSFSWGEVGKNDVAYGVGGGVAGAIVGGSVSLGVLTIPGWAAGAIGGAVGGSIGNAILQLWD